MDTNTTINQLIEMQAELINLFRAMEDRMDRIEKELVELAKKQANSPKHN